MSAPANAASQSDVMQRLLTRSATDRAFRAKLIAEPSAAIAEFAGKPGSEVPPALQRVRFIENTADATIVLPDVVAPAAELSEAELETVSGGTTPFCVLLAVDAALAAYLILEISHDTSHQ
jgi:hypothetical protein